MSYVIISHGFCMNYLPKIKRRYLLVLRCLRDLSKYITGIEITKSFPEVYKYIFFLILAGLFLTLRIGNNPIAQNLLISPQDTKSSNYVSQEEPQNQSTLPCQLAQTFTREVLHWTPEICRWSEQHQMDPDLIATIMQIESCGNNYAKSATGVRGLFQVTGANLAGGDPYNPDVSMARGPGYVLKSELSAANGNVTAAMAGYNGGGLARQWISGQITTNQFISRLRNNSSGYWRTLSKARSKVNEVSWYAQWSNIYYEAKLGKTDTLQKWLDMGGSRLCNSASIQLGLTQPAEPVISSTEVSKR